MAANTSISIATPDFDTLKGAFKDFLKSQSIFLDYDFEASNMNVLLDVMSYNTYLNAFYLNMVTAERFLDSAQIRDSVVSKSKELNYLPRSRASSAATVAVTIVENTGLRSLEIPKGTQFSGRNGNNSYVFSTDVAVVAKSTNGTFVFPAVQIFEGAYYSDTYVMDYSDETQRFIVMNAGVDIDSLTVTVTQNGVTAPYTQATTLFDLTPSSMVFFVHACEGDRYEIQFGDNNLGARPLDGSVIQLIYRVSAGGTAADGIETFVLDEDVAGLNGGGLVSTAVETVVSAAGGAERESIDSVKFNAPRHYATQERAVTTTDYASLIRDNFSGLVEDVHVFGGESVTPKQYGRVIISMKPIGGTILPEYVKDRVLVFLRKQNVGAIRPVIVDPEYFYLEIVTNIDFDTSYTHLKTSDLNSLITTTISTFSSDFLQKFDTDFRYSKFVGAIDATDDSVVSNDTTVRMIKRLTPKLRVATSYSIDFGNPAFQEGDYFGRVPPSEPSLASSSFTSIDDNDVEHPFSYLQDNGSGTVLMFQIVNNVDILLNANVGSIDYATGIVKLNRLRASDYTDHISLYFRTRGRDVIASNEKILLIDLNDVTVDITEMTG